MLTALQLQEKQVAEAARRNAEREAMERFRVDAKRNAKAGMAEIPGVMREANKQAVDQKREAAKQVEEAKRLDKQGLGKFDAESARGMQDYNLRTATGMQDFQANSAKAWSEMSGEEKRAATRFGATPGGANDGKSASLAEKSVTLADANADRRDLRSEVEKRGGATLVNGDADRTGEGRVAGNAGLYGRDAEGRAMNEDEFSRVEGLKKAGRDILAKGPPTKEDTETLTKIRGEVDGVSAPGAKAKKEEEPRGEAGVREDLREEDQARAAAGLEGGEARVVADEVSGDEAVAMTEAEGDVQQDVFGRWQAVEAEVVEWRLGRWVQPLETVTRTLAPRREDDLLVSSRVAARRGRISRGVVIP